MIGTFITGWVCGVLTVVGIGLFVWFKYRKFGQLVGVAKTSAQAADMVMKMLNSNPGLQQEIKKRLGI
jgi:hypothetical protein